MSARGRTAVELLAESLRGELDRLHSMAGLLELMDEHWPVAVFPIEADREDRDPGPRILSLARRLARAEKALADIEAFHCRDRGGAGVFCRHCGRQFPCRTIKIIGAARA